MTGDDPDATIAELQRRYFTTDGSRGVTGRGELDALQAHHDTAGHAAADPVNGSCFCCCEACDPTEYAP